MVNVNKATQGRPITQSRGWYPIYWGGDGVERAIHCKGRVVSRPIHDGILKMVKSVVRMKHGG